MILNHNIYYKIDNIDKLLSDCNEIKALLIASINTAKQNKTNPNHNLVRIFMFVTLLFSFFVFNFSLKFRKPTKRNGVASAEIY